MARFGLLLVILVGCGHKAQRTDSAPPVEVREGEGPAAEGPVAEEPAAEAPVAKTAASGKTAQVITFDDDADPEPTMMVRSPPARPKIPAFQLFGTRSSDGPR
jgi:hypothetical protein